MSSFSKGGFYYTITALHPEVTGSCLFVKVHYPDGKVTHFVIYVDYNIPLVGIYVLFGGNTNIFSGISTFFTSVTFITGISEL